MHQEWLDRFQQRSAHVAVIGLGYVGLPLAVSFAQAGYQVTGIDLDRRKVEAINSGASYIEDVPSEAVNVLVFGATETQAEPTLVHAYARSQEAVVTTSGSKPSNLKSKLMGHYQLF
jgi:UDP-N-acetyl-D-glucosamine dehydrogenase